MGDAYLTQSPLEELTQEKLLPLSDWIILGIPNLLNMSTSLGIILLALQLDMGIASAYRVAVHISVNKYSLPPLVRGKGPTTSTTTLSKGSPTILIGCKGALTGAWLLDN